LVSGDAVKICYHFTAEQTASNTYEVLLNSIKVKTSTYATLSHKFNQKVSNANLSNTCFLVDKKNLLSKNVLKVQDQTDKHCAFELVFDSYSINNNFVHFDLLNGGEVTETTKPYNFLEEKEGGIPMSVQLPSERIRTNAVVELPIVLGSEVTPVEGLYGIAFSLQMDDKVLDLQNIEIDFTDSWLGEDGDQLQSFSFFDALTGKLNISLTKTNGNSIKGHGNIATLRVIILIEIEPEKKASDFFSVDIEDILISTKSDGFDQINKKGIYIEKGISEIIAESNRPDHLSPKVNLYPTVANQSFSIQKNNHNEIDYTIFDLIGNTIHQNRLTSHLTTINTSHWPNGLYCVNLIIDNQTISKRILIRH